MWEEGGISECFLDGNKCKDGIVVPLYIICTVFCWKEVIEGMQNIRITWEKAVVKVDQPQEFPKFTVGGWLGELSNDLHFLLKGLDPLAVDSGLENIIL